PAQGPRPTAAEDRLTAGGTMTNYIDVLVRTDRADGACERATEGTAKFGEWLDRLARCHQATRDDLLVALRRGETIATIGFVFSIERRRTYPGIFCLVNDALGCQEAG
ncbi:MAG: hypothetical protein ACREXT_10400, partial [Gammaproteobacteria bacterium]